MKTIFLIAVILMAAGCATPRPPRAQKPCASTFSIRHVDGVRQVFADGSTDPVPHQLSTDGTIIIIRTR